jgi:hypothetical protein
MLLRALDTRAAFALLQMCVGRVGSWSGGSEVLRDLVSSPRITRSVQVSRTTRSCTLRAKGYEAYRMRAATQDDDW